MIEIVLKHLKDSEYSRKCCLEERRYYTYKIGYNYIGIGVHGNHHIVYKETNIEIVDKPVAIRPIQVFYEIALKTIRGTLGYIVFRRKCMSSIPSVILFF